MPYNYPLTDAHVHPDYSIDASGTLEDYCMRAMQLGLAEIIFTPHFDVNPDYPDQSLIVIDGKRVPTSRGALLRYAEDVWKVKEKYYELGLMVKCGVEVDYFKGVREDVLKWLDDPMIEYSMVGVHLVFGGSFANEGETARLFAEYSVEQLLDEYFKLVKDAVGLGVFDCLAHIDYYRRCAPADKMQEVMGIDYEFIDETLELMSDASLMMEVNTSAIRHGHRDYYPHTAFLNKARSRNVLIRHIGSDAHKPDQLGLDFETAEILIYETNLSDISEG